MKPISVPVASSGEGGGDNSELIAMI